jgi:2-amino-4-hydroxy-6-hydroxymethyldihydropteridine diphosphokinase
LCALKTDTAGTEGSSRSVWLGLGTNVGDLAGNLTRAVAGLARIMDVEAVSAVFETEPFGYTDQPLFWNLALRGRTVLEPHALLALLQQCERDLGRVPTFRMGPRVIDIDILLYDDIVLHTTDLILPHPGLETRAFVLLPLLDLDPDLAHPGTGMRLDRCAAAVDPSGVRRLGDAERVLGGGATGNSERGWP